MNTLYIFVLSTYGRFSIERERQYTVRVSDSNGGEIVFIAIVTKIEKKAAAAGQFRVARRECYYGYVPIVELSNWKTVISRVHSTRIPARHKPRI